MTRNIPVLLLATAALALGCGSGSTGPNPPPPPPSAPVVASVVVTPGADTLTALGQTRQLTALAKDASGAVISGKTFAWTSTAPTTVSIDAASGLATALGNGQATLTASVEGKSGQAVLLVDQQVGTVEISPTSGGAAALGTVTQFSAVARDASGAPIAGVKFLWVSSDPSVATVDSTGKVTAKAPGVATITAAGRGVPANAVFTVTQVATKLAVSIQPTGATEGRPFPGTVQVEVHDANDMLVAGARTPVTLALGTNPSGGSLGGAGTVTSVGGIATFSGLDIDRAGQGFTLVASAPSLTPATSAAFNVSLDFISVGAGNDETCGITAARLVYCWGSNSSGGIGDGTTTDRLVPTRVHTPPGVQFVRVEPGNPRTDCALATTGAVYCWGTGSLGVVSPGFSPVPLLVALPAGATFVSLSVAGSHACGTTPGGQVYCWGANSNHELADGTTSTRPTPVLAITPAGVLFTSVVAGGTETCGTSSLGLGYCWGLNGSGQIGDGTTTPALLPTPVAMPVGVTFVKTAVVAINGCGLATTGALYCWGANGNGQGGDGTTTSPHLTPTAVSMPAGVTFTDFTEAIGWACALGSNGVVYCWGNNGAGTLGDGTLISHLTPQPVTMPQGVIFRSLAGDATGHVCAVATAGAMYCWGNNSSGQLGDGTTVAHQLPTLVVR